MAKKERRPGSLLNRNGRLYFIVIAFDGMWGKRRKKLCKTSHWRKEGRLSTISRP
jgi:hypothetical protein